MRILIIDSSQKDIDTILRSQTSRELGPRLSFSFAGLEHEIMSAAEIASTYDVIVYDHCIEDWEPEFVPTTFTEKGFKGVIVANSSDSTKNKILVAAGADFERGSESKEGAVIYAVIAYIQNFIKNDPVISRVRAKLTNLAIHPYPNQIDMFLDEVDRLEVDPLVMKTALRLMFLGEGDKALPQAIFSGPFRAAVEKICTELEETNSPATKATA